MCSSNIPPTGMPDSAETEQAGNKRHKASGTCGCRRCVWHRRGHRFTRIIAAYGLRGFAYGVGGAAGSALAWYLITLIV